MVTSNPFASYVDEETRRRRAALGLPVKSARERRFELELEFANRGLTPGVLPVPIGAPDEEYIAAMEGVLAAREAQGGEQAIRARQAQARANLKTAVTRPLVTPEMVTHLPGPLQPIGNAAREFTSPAMIAATVASAGLGPAVAGGIRGGTGVAGAARGLLAAAAEPVGGSFAGRLAAEAALGTAATAASTEAGKALPEDAPGYVRVPVQTAAGLAGGIGVLKAGAAAPAIGRGVAKAGAAAERAGLPSPISVADATTPPRPAGAVTPSAAPAPSIPTEASAVVPPAVPATVVRSPVERLTEFLNTAPPLRRATEAERSKEIAIRAGRVAERLQDLNAPPQRALARATGELAGPLPKKPLPAIGRMEGEGIIPADDMFSQADVDSFFRTIQTTGVLRPLEKVNANKGLQKAFLGDLPQPNELELLERVFGAEFTRAMARHMKRGTWDTIIDATNLSRSAFQTVLDFGAFLRQGAILVPSRPIRASKSAVKALRAFGDEKYATKVATAREADPDYLRFTRNPIGKERLYVAPLKGAVSPTQREEVFISDLANTIPVIKQIVGASSRIHNTFLNELRYGVMKDIVRAWEKTGRAASDQELDILSRHLNYATGRGSLGPLNKFSRELSAALYSPRFLISRLQVPLPTLEAAIRREPRVLRETARDLLAFVGTGMTIATLLNKTRAADVETDARSPAFGRARIGNTTWDYWGGFQPLARYTWQAVTGQSKNVKTGKISNITPGPLTGKPDETVLWRFIRTKLAPGPGMAIDIRAGKSVSGKKLTPGLDTVEETAKNTLLPLFIQDMLEVAEEEGWSTAAGGLAPSFLGVGVTTFSDAETPKQETPPAKEDAPPARRRITVPSG